MRMGIQFGTSTRKQMIRFVAARDHGQNNHGYPDLIAMHILNLLAIEGIGRGENFFVRER